MEKQQVFASEAEAVRELQLMADQAEATLDHESGIAYLFIERRVDSYPAREEYLVAAPAAVETKARHFHFRDCLSSQNVQ